MDKNNIVINTLVFVEDLKKGVKQSNFLKDVSDLGIKKVEIRREFIRNFQEELKEIKDISEELEMELFYSVPEVLYVGGQLNKDKIEEAFKEANMMNCKNVKFNIGQCKSISSDNVNNINSLCHKYSIKLTIENDQTKEDGKVDKIENFLKVAVRLGMNISCTFDIGNWLWQNEDPKENAYKLKSYVTYIHLKDVNLKEKPETVLLDEGTIPWRSILEIFNKDIPVAVEYPCYPNTLVRLKGEIDKLVESK